MAKRNEGPQVAKSEGRRSGDALESRVVAYAEQLGRLIGTVQAKAEGWMDRKQLKQQIASIRDGAADLLERIAGDDRGEEAATPKPKRSGGVVDAPGKKHRGPVPADPRARAADRPRAKVGKSANTERMLKRRGRG